MKLALLFIAHDLSIVRHVSDQVAVMYLGKIVELASSEDIYVRPRHPYTQALVSAIPEPDPTHERTRIVLEGDVPSPIDPPPGCRFHTRCAYAAPQCREQVPELEDAGQGQFVACLRWREIESGAAKGAAETIDSEAES